MKTFLAPLLASLLSLALVAPAAHATDPVIRGQVFNRAVTNGVDIVPTDIQPAATASSALRITVALSDTASAFQVVIKRGATTSPALNMAEDGSDCQTGRLYKFVIGVTNAYTYNFQVGTSTTITYLLVEEIQGTALFASKSSSAGGGSGDITGVVAGNGLTGGAASGSATVDVAVGTGLTAAADEITLDEELVDVAGVTPTADQFLGGTGSALAMRTSSQVRASLVLATTDDVTFASVTATGHMLAQTYAGEIAAITTSSLDYASGAVQAFSISADTTFTGPVNDSATHARACRVKVTADATPRTLTFPAAWKWIGTKPATLAASTSAYLYLTSDGDQDADVVACWVVLGSGA